MERDSSWELAVVIACGIGLHNFSRTGHRHFCGFRRALPRAASHHRIRAAQCDRGLRHRCATGRVPVRPSWSRLALLGLIGGAPTFVGTLIGQRFVSENLAIAFLALAAGPVLYVVIELLPVVDEPE